MRIYGLILLQTCCADIYMAFLNLVLRPIYSVFENYPVYVAIGLCKYVTNKATLLLMHLFLLGSYFATLSNTIHSFIDICCYAGINVF
uniref:Uncharacterized protein n=1 Tax=Ditylenchus dipsaci TaxID=166011 RepID=A0A915EL49_9BILA